jgi:hypothetical protein
VIKVKEISRWLALLLWPTLVVVSAWALRVDGGLSYRLLVVILFISSIVFAWWQKRLYLASISLVFICASSLNVYMQNSGADGFSLIAAYTVLVFVLATACFSSFLTYTLKVNKPMIMVYLVGVIFLCLEFFWLLSLLAADPIIKALLVAGLFHITFTMVALYSWGRLSKASFRWYVIISSLFFSVFIKIM